MVEIVLGLPKGSLNNVKRGNTYQLFIDAGYEVQGYEPGDESYEIEILNDDEIKAYLATISGVALGSDAFFPFSDNIERAKRSGVKYYFC